VPEGLVQPGHLLRTQVVTLQEQQPAGALDRGLHPLGGLALEGAAQFIELLGHKLDEVEAVEHHRRPGQVLGHRAPVGGRQVAADGPDLRPGLPQQRPELRQRGGPLAPGHPHDPAVLQIDDHGVELPRLAHVDLVDGRGNAARAGPAGRSPPPGAPGPVP